MLELAERSAGAEAASCPEAATRLITERLAQRIGHHTYDMWFGDTTTLRVEGSCVQVTTDSRFVAEWIEGHFSEALDETARETLGHEASVDLRVAPELFDRLRTDGGKRARNGAGPSRGPRRRPATGLRRLEDFVVGSSNTLAFTAARRLAEDAARTSSPLFVYGTCGVGKTHLLQGIAHRCLEATTARGNPAIRYLTAEQFTNEYIHAVRTSTIDRFRKRVRRLEVLAIDDVHFLANKTATQNELLHTIDAIDLSGSRLVLASDQHPLRLGFNQALSSRFVAGMVARVESPDRATSLQLIHKLAAARGHQIAEAAAERIAAVCAGSVRELEGAVNKLTALKTLANGAGPDVGVVLVERLLADGSWRPKTPVRIEALVDAVCARLVVNRAQLLGSGRHRRVVAARGLVAYLARELTTMSYPEIAAALGRKHHSTVHTAAGRIARQLREQRRMDLGDGGEPVTINELVDRLRRDVAQAAKT